MSESLLKSTCLCMAFLSMAACSGSLPATGTDKTNLSPLASASAAPFVDTKPGASALPIADSSALLNPVVPGASPLPAVAATALPALSDKTDTSTVETTIQSAMQKQDIPGLAAALVKKDKIVWSKGYGFANKAIQQPVTSDTLFLLASVSKTVTYVNLLQLYDQGKFGLDADVNTYLPFSVRNPNHPDTPITFRMLMAHQSSIKDNNTFDVYTRGGDSPIPLGQFLKDYFSPGGKYHSTELNYSAAKPGTAYDYSNIGTALSGYLVETISNQDFAQYSNQQLFTPLNMKNSSWFLRTLNQEQLAIPYDGNNQPLQHYTFADYPNGQLRSSVNDMAKFLSMMMQKGTGNGVSILKPETVTEALRKQYPNNEYGLGWHYHSVQERTYFGHEGSESGVSTVMMYNPATQVGALVFANKRELKLEEIVDTLIQVGER